MDDWDLVSNDTPPNSATDAWDAVSTPDPTIERKQQTHHSQPKPREARPPVKRRAITGSSIAIIVLCIAVIGLSAFSALDIFHVVNFNRGNAIVAVTQQTQGQTSGQAQATSIIADANASATTLTSLEQAEITSTPNATVTFPTIVSVSQFGPVQNQEITISGKGFGTHAPFTNSTTNYMSINDVTDSNWQAGYGYDWVTVNVSLWNDSEIVITGFSGYYGKDGFVYRIGDKVTISIWNAQSGEGGTGSALISLTVAG